MTLDLPSRAVAVALASIGYAPLKPRVSRNDRTGKVVLTWTLAGPQCIQGQQTVDGFANPDPTRNPARLKPEHPYLACLYYQENVLALKTWIQTGAAPLCVRGTGESRLLRLLPDQLKLRSHQLAPAVWWSNAIASKAAAAAVADPLAAAVAVLCGFVPRPELDLAAGLPRFVFAAESLTFPGLLFRDLQTASPESQLGSYPAGEHPACYAFACAANLADFIQAEALALQNPTHQFKGRGTNSAMMSENLIRSRNIFYRDSLKRHLAAP